MHNLKTHIRLTLRVSDSRPRTTKENRMPNDHQTTGEPGGCSADPLVLRRREYGMMKSNASNAVRRG